MTAPDRSSPQSSNAFKETLMQVKAFESAKFKVYICVCMYKLLIWLDVYLLSGFTYQAQCSFCYEILLQFYLCIFV